MIDALLMATELVLMLLLIVEPRRSRSSSNPSSLGLFSFAEKNKEAPGARSSTDA